MGSSGGKGGGETGASALQTEAYTNFAGYGQQYGGDIGGVPGYAAWAGANPDLLDAANMGFAEGAAAKSTQDTYANLLWQMQRPAELAAVSNYGAGIAGTLSNKESSFESVNEALVRQHYWGTTGPLGDDTYADFGQHAKDVFGEGYGVVWDENASFDFKGNAPGYQGGWRAVSQEEYAKISELGRDEVLSTYGGLYSPEGENVFEKYQGEAGRDEAYVGYLEAGKAASGVVDAQIARERAQANLIGVEYNVTDDQRRSRVNSEFANVWSSEQDAEFRKRMETYGNPEGFTGYLYERGAATTTPDSAYTEDVQGTTTTAPGTKVPNLLEEEDILGGAPMLLGG